MHLLLVEDDERLARALTRLLEEDRHVVEHAPDGRTGPRARLGARRARRRDPRHRPARHVRARRRPAHLRKDGIDVSILMLTARDTVNDRVPGLDAGADDYVVKPFAYQEVAARLRALARRAEPGPRRAEPKLTAGAIALDEAARRVTVSGRNVDLSPREFSLLEALLRHAGQTLTRDQLLDHAWPFSVAVTPERRRRLRALPADQARRRRLPGRDRPRRGVPPRRWLTARGSTPREDDAEQAALAEDGRLIRRTRWRLVAWSGLSTLVVLVVLGGGAVRRGRADARRRVRRPARGAGRAAGSSGLEGDRSPTTAARTRVGFMFGGGNTLPLPVRRRRRRRSQLGRERVGRARRAAATARASMPPRAAADGRRRAARPDDRADGPTVVPVRLLTQQVDASSDGNDLLRPGAPGPHDRGRDAQRRCSSRCSSAGCVVVLVAFGFGALYAQPRARADPPVARDAARSPSAASASSPPTRATSCARR